MPIPKTNFCPPFNITRASHLTLTAQDLPASRVFYTEVIGLIVADEDANTLYLRGVEERQHHSLTLKKTTDEPSCEAIGMHVFDEEDLDRAKAHFDKIGIACFVQGTGTPRSTMLENLGSLGSSGCFSTSAHSFFHSRSLWIEIRMSLPSLERNAP